MTFSALCCKYLKNQQCNALPPSTFCSFARLSFEAFPPIPRQCCGILRTEWETRGPSSFLVSMLTAVENHQNEPLGRSQSLSRTQTQRGSRGCRSETSWLLSSSSWCWLLILDRSVAGASSEVRSGTHRRHNCLKPACARNPILVILLNLTICWTQLITLCCHLTIRWALGRFLNLTLCCKARSVLSRDCLGSRNSEVHVTELRS